MNNERQINPQGQNEPDQAPTQRSPEQNPVRESYDQQPIDREDGPGRIGQPGNPNPDPTFEPRRPQVTSDVPGGGVFNGPDRDRPDSDTEAGVAQNFDNEALYGQDDYALFSRKLDEFDKRLTQEGFDPNDPQNFREQSASLRARLEDAQRQGQDQWQKSQQGLRDSFGELEQSWNDWRGNRPGQTDSAKTPETNP